MPNAEIFGHMIAWGEVLVGIALIIGAFTGIAAFFGLFMNLNFLLAGTVSINPVLFVLGIGVMLAWKVAGYYGIDRWLLPKLGTPWRFSG
jgi:thiosulfate dehydrogenase [quinone] large subunit